MPDDVSDALDRRDLTKLYLERPFYQRNDYLAWIARAVRPDTRQRRIDQMLYELEQGGVYMKMDHPASRKS